MAPQFKPAIKNTLSNLNTHTGVKRDQYHFEYWAGASDFDWDLGDKEEGAEHSFDTIMQLAGLRRAAANFVRILTGDNTIRVTYSSGKDSYTDGKTVVLSAEESPEKFDKAVAVALHEAAHCLLTDFTFANFALKLESSCFFPPHFNTANWIQLATMIMNVIEDRRIDEFVYRTAEGYRPYYRMLYKEYWNSPETSKALRIKPEWQLPTEEAYIERIINISNPAAWDTRHLLPGIDEIYQLIDLPNISRLNTEPNDYRAFVMDERNYSRKQQNAIVTKVPAAHFIPNDWFSDQRKYHIDPVRFPEIFRITLQIMEIIRVNIVLGEANAKQQDASGKGAPAPGDSSPGSSQPDSDENGLPNLDLSRSSGEESPGSAPAQDTKPAKPGPPGSAPAQDTKPAKPGRKTKAEKAQTVNETKLAKEQQKTKSWLKGDVRKKKIARNLEKDVAAMEDTKATIHQVGNAKIGRGRVVVTTEMTDKLLASDWFMFASRDYYGVVKAHMGREESILKGIRMGQILSHRLAVRNEQVTTKFPNQNAGRIDRRNIARLGMDIENVFSQLIQDAFRPALIHFSLDASGSMSGAKWKQAVVVATALSYAATKISNLDVIISIRGGVATRNSNLAHLAIVHDSRKNVFSHFRKYMSLLTPNGGTPEGLCFEAILESMLAETQDYTVYFVNISDGQPGFTASPVGSARTIKRHRYLPGVTDVEEKGIEYSGNVAYTHTRQQINKMRESGVRVLSYFVEVDTKYTYHYKEPAEGPFKLMYGDDARFIDVTQVTGIVTTMNQLLLKRG